jgi:hypothetical protein
MRLRARQRALFQSLKEPSERRFKLRRSVLE